MIDFSPIINAFTLDIALIIGAVIGAILTLLASLLALGWGKTKVEEHITGKTDWGARNRLYADQIHNGRLLAMGDRTQTDETLSNLSNL